MYNPFGHEAGQSAGQSRDHLAAVDGEPRSDAVFKGRCVFYMLRNKPWCLRDIVFVADPSVYGDLVDGEYVGLCSQPLIATVLCPPSFSRL